MSTSLVTGGAGFMGSHVAELLLNMGHDVVVLDDLSGGFFANVPSRADFVRGSVLDYELINEIFVRYEFDYVFHLAAYAAEGLSHFIKRFNYTNNLIGTANLINASVNYEAQHFVFTSSIAVYGSGQTPMTEDMIPVPEDSYGIAKLACEQELRITQELFGLNYTIFRPHNVYGEKQNIGDRYRNVVGIFMNQILKGEPMTIFGDGEQQRAFTHICDVAPLIAECVEVPSALNETFNVGADVPCTVNELAGMIARVMGAECRVQHLQPRNEVKCAFANHCKSEQAFGIRAKLPLVEGLKLMADWVRQYGPKNSSTFDAIEIDRRLPECWSRAVNRAVPVG